MDTWKELLDSLPNTVGFLGIPEVMKRFRWSEEDNGFILVEKDSVHDTPAQLTAIGRVSRSRCNVAPLGGFKPTLKAKIEKSKYNLGIKNPGIDKLSAAWDATIDNLKKCLLSGNADFPDKRNLMENKKELRLVAPVFSERVRLYSFSPSDLLLIYFDWNSPLRVK